MAQPVPRLGLTGLPAFTKNDPNPERYARFG
jgi:hypothetical protein